MTVHRRRRLDSLAEGDNALGAAESHRLNNVMPALLTVRNHRKSQTLIEIGGKDGSF